MNTLNELTALREKIETIMREKPEGSEDSLQGVLDYLGDAIDAVEKYNGVGKYEPTYAELRHMDMERAGERA